MSADVVLFQTSCTKRAAATSRESPHSPNLSPEPCEQLISLKNLRNCCNEAGRNKLDKHRIIVMNFIYLRRVRHEPLGSIPNMEPYREPPESSVERFPQIGDHLFGVPMLR